MEIDQKDLHYSLLYLVELQKALTIAEEQMENVKVDNRVIDSAFDWFRLFVDRKNVMICHIHWTPYDTVIPEEVCHCKETRKYTSTCLVIFQGHQTVQLLPFPLLHLVHPRVIHRIFHLLHHYHHPVWMNIILDFFECSFMFRFHSSTTSSWTGMFEYEWSVVLWKALLASTDIRSTTTWHARCSARFNDNKEENSNEI